MQLDELQSVRDRERQTDKLQQLRESFYVEAGEFIQQLRAERDRAAERADDPFDAPEVNRLTDEINTAEQTVEAIYEKRVGKIVKAASFAAADLPAEVNGMTQEEQELFDQLVADIKANRQQVLDVLAGDAPAVSDTGTSPANDDAGSPPVDDGRGEEPAGPGQPTTDPSPPAEAEEGVAAADLMGGDPSPPEPVQETRSEGSDQQPEPPEGEKLRNDGGDVEAADPPASTGAPATAEQSTGGETTSADEPPTEVDRRTVLVTDDVGTFVGSDDRDYDLERDDVVTLPAANADLLIDRDAAERL